MEVYIFFKKATLTIVNRQWRINSTEYKFYKYVSWLFSICF